MAAQEVVDTDPHSVLRNDGITNADLDGSYNQVITRLEETKKRMGAPPWSVRVVYNEIISGVLICQNPGEGNRWHYHPDSDEWWVLLEGEMEWDIEGVGKIQAGPGDIVFCRRQVRHIMKCIGSKPSIRLSISIPDVPHVFPQDEAK